MLRLLRSELFRLRKRPQSWVLGIILLGGVVTLYVGLVIAAFVLSNPSEPKEAVVPANVFNSGMQLVAGLGYLLVAIVSASLIGNEYSWGTIRPLVARAVSRNALVTAKLLTLAIYTVGLLLAGLVAAICCSVISSLVVGETIAIGPGVVGDWTISFVRMLIAAAPYAVLVFFVTMLSRSTAVGIGVGVGIGLLEPAIWALVGLMTDALEPVRKFGLDYPSTQLFNMNAGIGTVTAGEASRATAVLLLWTVLFVIATYVVFNRRDVTSG